MPNTMKFYGEPISGEVQLGKQDIAENINLINAFTTEKTPSNWDSINSNNLNHLIDIVKSGIKASKKLYLLVPGDRTTMDFEFFEGQQISRLGIKIYLPERKGFGATFYFQDVKTGKSFKVPRIFSFWDPAGMEIIPLAVKGNMVAA